MGAGVATLALLTGRAADAALRTRGTRPAAGSSDRTIGAESGVGSEIRPGLSALDAALPRCGHTATALPDGRVLIAGGDFMGPLSSAEILDPITGRSWTAAAMGTPRAYHAAAALPDGRIIVMGGYFNGPLSGVEIYDPATGTWELAAPMNLARCQHAALALPGGQVIVTGGIADSTLSGMEVYDPSADRWTLSL